MHWFPLALICALSLALADTASKKWLADRSAGELTLIRFGLPGLLLLPLFLALAQAATAYMIAVKRTSILFGILLGAWVFREAGLARHLAAGGVMVAGVALIVTS